MCSNYEREPGIIIARGRLIKTRNRGRYVAYFIRIRKPRGEPLPSLEFLAGRDVTVIITTGKVRLR
jgi:hypothetical protein